MTRFYFQSRRRLRQIFAFFEAIFDGIWLGLLDRESLHRIDEHCYDSWSEYHSEEHNRRGWFAWEEEAVTTYFGDCRRLLVAGAGGGREVLALCKAGYEVDAFECHPALAALANRWLREAGFSCEVDVVARDQTAPRSRSYDGLIVGWGTYMLIQGRDKRVAFLRSLRDRVPARAPVLLSFHHRDPAPRRFKVIAAVGNLFRWILRRRRLDLGDALAPNYVHYFAKEEIASELRQAGFEMVFHGTEDYGRAVALAGLSR
ncbi:MAG: SAM-dependent methyltransferase [bacterium]|nr:SAM-dependent methyltransferase [bacterium]